MFVTTCQQTTICFRGISYVVFFPPRFLEWESFFLIAPFPDSFLLLPFSKVHQVSIDICLNFLSLTKLTMEALCVQKRRTLKITKAVNWTVKVRRSKF